MEDFDHDLLGLGRVLAAHGLDAADICLRLPLALGTAIRAVSGEALL